MTKSAKNEIYISQIHDDGSKAVAALREMACEYNGGIAAANAPRIGRINAAHDVGVSFGDLGKAQTPDRSMEVAMAKYMDPTLAFARSSNAGLPKAPQEIGFAR